MNEKDTLLEEIKNITDSIYQNRIKDGVEQLPSFISQLSTVVNTIPNEKSQDFYRALKTIMEAMEMKDYIALADVLTFDVLPILE